MKNFIILLNVVIILWVTSILSLDYNSEKADFNGDPSIEAAKHELAAGTGIESNEIKPATASSKISSSPKESSKSNASATAIVSRETLDFIREVAEAIVLDIERGKVAQQQASSNALKDYVTSMVNDQSKMLEDLKSIAEKKNLEFSTLVDKSAQSKVLKGRTGKDFDDKFIKMMIIDHKREVKKFERALPSPDPDIQVFASNYLQFMKSNLDKIKTIRRNSKLS